MTTRFGGSIAPPLTEESLDQYSDLVESVDSTDQIGDALRVLLKCVKKWWELPESTSEGTTHKSGTGTVITLDKEIEKALWELIPWKNELQAYGELFNQIENKQLRNCAFHLLWFVTELELGREPITLDKI